jgi:hypothetical protein
VRAHWRATTPMRPTHSGWRHRAGNRRTVPRPVLCAALAVLLVGCEGQTGAVLELTVIEARSGTVTPARIELLDEAGAGHVPSQALAVAGDCGWLPIHNWIPGAARVQMRRALSSEVRNPFTGSSQFYLAEPAAMRLPAGRYTVRAFKGIEYKVAEAEIEVRDGETAALGLGLVRWVDMPAEGWYGADDHLHIPRPSRRFDERIARWMEAEDLHVANLLQTGLARSIHITPQRAFGSPSVYQTEGTLLASGQENPRTHVLGHSIILGAPQWIDYPEDYLAYDRFWRQARQDGAVSGFAHWGVGGADEGLAVWIPEGLLDFLEVLGFGLPYYDAWYQLLDLGIRLTPTAGTDYPCSPSLPGRERFYTQVDGELTYDAWLDAVRRGRSFVTNGPVLDFSVNGVSMGDELHLQAPGTVTVAGRVRFDPQRDDVVSLELVGSGGEVLFSSGERTRTGEIRIELELPVSRATWLAVRASGHKLHETPVDFTAGLAAALMQLERASNEEILKRLPADGSPRPSAAHSAPVFVAVAGSPSLAQQPRAAEAAAAWLARLEELERRFAPDRIGELAGFPGRGDGLKLEDLEGGREELLRAIERARTAYHEWQHRHGHAHD